MSFDSKEIENLRTVYNRENSTESPIPSGNMIEVWKTLKDRLKSKCKSGSAECIITSLISKPSAPKSWAVNPEEWLSSDDIEHLEKQFTKVFSNYHYVGTFPIDFDKKSQTGSCLVSALCSMNIRELYNKGFTQFGLIFNTDVSTGPGEHWIALFCDVSPELEYPRITYFDSYAHKPEKEIQRLMKRWKEQWDSTKVHSQPMKMTYNNTRHQYQDSECGMYCLYFHYCCLLNLSMSETIPDDVVRGFRGMLFHVGKK
jgi:Ulp1 family protease